jgi:hypothetical protein
MRDDTAHEPVRLGMRNAVAHLGEHEQQSRADTRSASSSVLQMWKGSTQTVTAAMREKREVS